MESLSATPEKMNIGAPETIMPAPKRLMTTIERDQEIKVLEEKSANDMADYQRVREALGLPPTNEVPASIAARKEKIDELQSQAPASDESSVAQHPEAEPGSPDLMHSYETMQQFDIARQIAAKPDVQEKLRNLSQSDWESLNRTGTLANGEWLTAFSTGPIDPEIARRIVMGKFNETKTETKVHTYVRNATPQGNSGNEMN